MVKQNERPKVGQRKGSIYQTNVSRLYFLAKGCKQVPPEHARNIVRWGHPDGYFLNALGKKVSDNLTESHKKHCHKHPAPNLSNGGISCHVAMALAFYGERPIFKDKNGKPYVGICHHIIPDLLDYRPANLLCWLTREQHYEADRRQRLIKKAVGMRGMYEIGYERLRYYQDPRETSATDFEAWLYLFKEE